MNRHALITVLILALAWTPALASSRYKMKYDGLPNAVPNLQHLTSAVPKAEQLSEHGNPSHYQVDGQHYEVLASAKDYDEIGTASWYGVKFHGELTSNRENYDMFAMTAASKTLPIPTYVRVKNMENGRSIIVRVNDRGPFVNDRIIDLSFAAASKLGMIKDGTATVRVTALTTPYVVDEKSSKISHDLGHFLLLGSFKEQDNALKMIAKVSKFTPYPLRIRASRGNKHTFYRVELGPFDGVHNLKEVKQLLKQKGIAPVFARLG